MDLNIFTADHLLKIGLSAVFFTFIDRFGAVPISRALVPAYSQFKSYQVTQWNSRVAAIIHSVIVCPIAIYLLFQTELLNHPVTGVTQASDDLCCFAAGYFLWDLFMCFFYFKDYGVGFTIHAVCCLYTYLSHLVRSSLSLFPSPRLGGTISRCKTHSECGAGTLGTVSDRRGREGHSWRFEPSTLGRETVQRVVLTL